MKKLLIITLSSIALFSCRPSLRGSGNIITQKRSVGNFKSLSASTSIEVDVKIGSTYEVSVEADDNVVDYVKTEVVGGTLKIRYADNTSLRNASVTVHVTVPTLEKLSASSSAKIEVDGTLTNTSKIEFDASSSAEIDATVDAPQIDADANSSANITLSGKTQNFKVEVSSSAVIKAEDLLSENTTADANSSGTAYVYASVKLDGKANSSGAVKYRGGAAVTKNESSSGSVEKE
jgi:Putative auto-transporter adhesin, head GIN domain